MLAKTTIREKRALDRKMGFERDFARLYSISILISDPKKYLY